MPELSPILDRFAPSAIAGMTDIVARMQNEGHTLYNLSIGEPEFQTPSHICDAAKLAIDRGLTKYSPTDGTYALRQAVKQKYARDNNLDFDLEQIVVAAGAKPLLADLIRTVAADDDSVALATPCWTSHVGMIRLAGANPVFIPTSQKQGFKMTADSLAAGLSNNPRALLLCAPSNPSGAVYSAEELEAVATVLRQYKDLWIITDDLYEHIVFHGRRAHSILEIAPDLADRTVLVNGVSKAYAMTGWRIGYAAGPPTLMGGLRKLMSQATGCPCSISEAAAIAALDGSKEFISSSVKTYQARAERLVPRLNQIPGLECLQPEGAFYLYPNCAKLIGLLRPDGRPINSSTDFAAYLLEEWSVVVVPGSAFELDPHIRISIATADEILDHAFDQIDQAVNALRRP